MHLKSIKIKTMISIGFGSVLFLLAIVGVLSFKGVSNIVGNANQVIKGSKLDGLLAGREVDHLNWANKVNALLTDKSITKLQVETDDHKCAFGKWLYGEDRKSAESELPSISPLLKQIEAPHRKLHDSAVEIAGKFHRADPFLGSFLRDRKVDHLNWALKVKDSFIHKSKILDIEMDHRKCGLGRWMYSQEISDLKKSEPEFATLLTAMEEPHHKLHESAGEIARLLAEGGHEEAEALYAQTTDIYADKTCEVLDSLVAWHDKDMKGMQEANEIYASQTMPALAETQSLLKSIREQAKANVISDEGMLLAAQSTKSYVGLISLIAIALGVILACLTARTITTILQDVTTKMSGTAESVASASSQVSSTSQLLAEGASQQAASIEETSSSLEEIGTMTRQNAEHASQANNLMKEASEVISKANESMRGLTSSMGEISKASEDTQKIIKTIDEIAFQTNLLALNAAVEAARAGEAGAGFAVVADEVRNLAMRAAEAAKSTAGLIEGTVERIKDGSKLVETTNEEFSRVSTIVVKSGELVGEIAAACQEQAQGIEQVNVAVSEMEKVTQQNSVSAEESASASEEMNAQAEQMKDFVERLASLVGGSVSGRGKEKAASPGKKSQTYATVHHASISQNRLVHQSRSDNGVANGKAVPKYEVERPELSPEKVLPLHDDF